jgi:hypothetical protein
MRNLLIAIVITVLMNACNTRQGSNEPALDNRYNPAEMPVDSVGAKRDMPSAATDSNKSGKATVPTGGSDLETGGQNQTEKTIGSDGNIVNQKDSTNKK